MCNTIHPHDNLFLAPLAACHMPVVCVCRSGTSAITLGFSGTMCILMYPIRNHTIWGLVIWRTTTVGDGRFQMHVTSIVIGTHCSSRDQLYCGNRPLQNINNKAIQNKGHLKHCALSDRARLTKHNL